MNTVILIQLILAHILSDFVFQTKKIVESKNNQGLKSPLFWFHTSLSGILTYLILMQWGNWIIPLFIFISHSLIDFCKVILERRITDYNNNTQNTTKKTRTSLFFIDQLFHIVVIVVAWLYMSKSFDLIVPFIESMVMSKKNLTILTALILIIWPVGLAIGKITEPFRNELSSNSDSLNKAGSYIGTFERLLVFIFILMGQYAAIGFLIAAKSVLRISKDGDDNARKKTEYVLIGTLISFTTAIVIGLITKKIIQ